MEKNFFTQIRSCIKVFNLGKNMACQYFIFKLMFVIGYNNQSKLVRRKIICKLLVKDNQNNFPGINPMVLSALRTNFLEIIALKPVKNWCGLTQWALATLGPTLLILLPWNLLKKLGMNPMGISDPWADSLVIISFQTVKKH